ncbi:MAG: ribonuclease HII [Methanomassiliicoccales archaeon]
MICGVDEAGRGPFIGPLVIAAVMVPDDVTLKAMKVRDSKQLSPARRERLAEEIFTSSQVRVRIIEADVLDRLMVREDLNQIEVKEFASLISELKAEHVFADACDVDPRRFARNIESLLPYKPVLICEHKADEKYPVVSAASIIAKTLRDRRMREIEQELGTEIGSGYSHDEKSIAFLEKWIKEKRDVPPHTRRSWETVRSRLSVSKNAKLTEWEW